MFSRLFKLVFIISTITLLTACDLVELLIDEPLDTEIEVETIALEDLQGTENFKQGALEHILEGEINRKGDVVGFHYEGLATAKATVIDGTRTDPDTKGVYEAEVEINGLKKAGNRGISSFFPLHWNAQEVVDAINEAYEGKEFIRGNTYEGISEEGVIIHMYLDQNDKIISAFPVS